MVSVNAMLLRALSIMRPIGDASASLKPTMFLHLVSSRFNVPLVSKSLGIVNNVFKPADTNQALKDSGIEILMTTFI